MRVRVRVRVRVRACGWGKDPLLGRPMLSLAKSRSGAIFPIAVTKVSFNLSLLHGGAQDVVCCSLGCVVFGFHSCRALRAYGFFSECWAARGQPMAGHGQVSAMAGHGQPVAGHDHPFIGQLLVGHG